MNAPDQPFVDAMGTSGVARFMGRAAFSCARPLQSAARVHTSVTATETSGPDAPA